MVLEKYWENIQYSVMLLFSELAHSCRPGNSTVVMKTLAIATFTSDVLLIY